MVTSRSTEATLRARAEWGSTGDSPADVDGDQEVNGGHLAIILATWDS